MRAAFVVLVLIASAGAGLAQPRHADPPRDLWCRDMTITDGAAVQYCMAYTLEQCLASRSSPNERCYLNPIYDPRFRR